MSTLTGSQADTRSSANSAFIGGRRLLWWGKAALAVMIAFAPAAARADELERTVTDFLANTFLKAGCSDNAKFRLGLWQFDQGKIPISERGGRRIYDELTALLMRKLPFCADIIDSEGVGAVMTYLHSSGALDKNGGNVIAALTEAHQNVDLVVFPDLYMHNGQLVLTLRAVQTLGGKTIGQSTPLNMPDSYLAEDPADEAGPLKSVLATAAGFFEQELKEAGPVRFAGVYFADSAAQPPAGRYLKDQISAVLSDKLRNDITGEQVRLRSVTITVEDPNKVEPHELSSELSAEHDGVSTLSGRYWQVGDAIDLVLTLKLVGGDIISWKGRFRAAELTGLDIEPINDAVVTRPLLTGDLGFQLTTERGEAPFYQVGDELKLLMQSTEAAFAYCFYVDAQGAVQTILPLPASVTASSNRLEPGVLRTIPEGNVVFRFTDASVGEELVTCFATRREIQPELPMVLFPTEFGTIPNIDIARLRGLFGFYTDAGVTEATVTISLSARE
jgi:hypothetical protein